jgi:alpha/beta superfamily hydrolase
MYPSGNLLIPAPHGRLEAILKEPRVLPPLGVALVLHPHPLGGGTMHNKVVFRAAAALNDAGLLTLRINFRGVGQSTGTHDEGRGELDDVRVALDYLSGKYPGLGYESGMGVPPMVLAQEASAPTTHAQDAHATAHAQPITLCGFSFGARVGLEVGIADERVKNLVSIGTPIAKYDFGFLTTCRKPILFVHGSRDEFGTPDELKKLISQLGPDVDVQLVVIPDADHFFEGHLDELKQAITAWAKERINSI